MDDENRKNENSDNMAGWWNAYDTDKEEEASEAESDTDSEIEEYIDDAVHGTRLHFLKIPGIIALAIAVLAIAVGAAYASGIISIPAIGVNIQAEQQIEDPVESEGQAGTGKVVFKLSISDMPENTTQAEIAVAKINEDGNADFSDSPRITVTPNEETDLGEYEPGCYEVKVVTLPKCDNCTFTAPLLPTKFTVSENGSTVQTGSSLTVKKNDDTGETESQSSKKAADKTTSAKSKKKKQTSKSLSSISKTETEESSSTAASTSAVATSTKTTHKHTWKAIYKTIHHKAVYRTVHHDAVKKRVKVPTAAGEGLNGKDYKYEYKTIKAAYVEKVVVSKAYDEKKIVGWKCSGCGATK